MWCGLLRHLVFGCWGLLCLAKQASSLRGKTNATENSRALNPARITSNFVATSTYRKGNCRRLTWRIRSRTCKTLGRSKTACRPPPLSGPSAVAHFAIARRHVRRAERSWRALAGAFPLTPPGDRQGLQTARGWC